MASYSQVIRFMTAHCMTISIIPSQINSARVCAGSDRCLSAGFMLAILPVLAGNGCKRLLMNISLVSAACSVPARRAVTKQRLGAAGASILCHGQRQTDGKPKEQIVPLTEEIS